MLLPLPSPLFSYGSRSAPVPIEPPGTRKLSPPFKNFYHQATCVPFDTLTPEGVIYGRIISGLQLPPLPPLKITSHTPLCQNYSNVFRSPPHMSHKTRHVFPQNGPPAMHPNGLGTIWRPNPSTIIHLGIFYPLVVCLTHIPRVVLTPGTHILTSEVCKAAFFHSSVVVYYFNMGWPSQA